MFLAPPVGSGEGHTAGSTAASQLARLDSANGAPPVGSRSLARDAHPTDDAVSVVEVLDEWVRFVGEDCDGGDVIDRHKEDTPTSIDRTTL